MNIYDILNSRSIAEYWKEIEYVPAPVETAWIVYSSRKLNFEQQCAFWEEIINTMPDTEIKKRVHCPRYDSLHGFLRRFMDINRRFLDWFHNSENCVYTITGDGYQCEMAFSSMDKVKEFISDDNDLDADKYVVSKVLINDFERYPACITVNNNCEPVLYENWVYRTFPHTEEEDDLLFAFEGMWFDFPIPFKKGDVLFNRYYNTNCFGTRHFDGDFTDLYAVVSTGLDGWSEKAKKWFFEGSSGDGSDMVFHGYAQMSNGSLYTESFGNYMDYEFYNGDFKGKQHLIKLISNRLKDIINDELFVTVYHQILCEERAKDDIPFLYSRETLEFAGVNVDKNDGA